MQGAGFRGGKSSKQGDAGRADDGSRAALPSHRPCAQHYVGKSQSCMVISGRLIVHTFHIAELLEAALDFLEREQFQFSVWRRSCEVVQHQLE